MNRVDVVNFVRSTPAYVDKFLFALTRGSAKNMAEGVLLSIA